MTGLLYPPPVGSDYEQAFILDTSSPVIICINSSVYGPRTKIGLLMCDACCHEKKGSLCDSIMVIIVIGIQNKSQLSKSKSKMNACLYSHKRSKKDKYWNDLNPVQKMGVAVIPVALA